MKKLLRRIITFVTVMVVLVYGTGVVYDYFTDGFTVGQIISDREPDSKWKTASVALSLDQEYSYLGKGCQSYVFLSEDGKAVLKFVKLKHFRVPFWMNAFSFVPDIKKQVLRKEAKKKKELDQLFQCWKDSYEQLPEETGVLYVHLDQSKIAESIRLRDKMGFLHEVPVEKVDFLVQQRAELLAPALQSLMQEGKVTEARLIITRLFQMCVKEYLRGYGDLDHALMQNTGVINGRSIHVDVGQIVYREEFKQPEVYHQELYNKTFAFRVWLKKEYPELADHAKLELIKIIGEKKFVGMKYSLKYSG